MAAEIDPAAGGLRVAIAVSRYNEAVTRRLLDGATQSLARDGIGEQDVVAVWVPGAFELPIACQWLAETGNYDAVIALGAVIRVDTSHYDYVCEQAARGILDVSLSTSVPVAFGVLTCENQQQAEDRAGGRAGNKGAEAARAALEMVALRRAIAGE